MCEIRPIETLPAMAARTTVDPFSRILEGQARRPFRTPAGSAAASCWAAQVGEDARKRSAEKRRSRAPGVS